MLRETLAITALQSGVLFLALWGIFRLAPSIPANAKAWLWRLAFLKPLISLLPFAVISLPFLPAEKPPVELVDSTTMQSTFEFTANTSFVEIPPATPASRPDFLLLAWGLGVCAVALWGLGGMARAMRMASRATAVTNEDILEAFDELAEAAQVRKLPRLLQSEDITSAVLVGGRKPAVLIPSDAALGDLRLMMAHELAHIARRDLFWFGLASAVQSLFFFNPMVWVAARCSRLDHESATDRHASHLAGVPIQTYADMLLRATVVARPSFAPGSLPVAESYRSIHRRLEAMRHFNSKPTFWRKTATAALAMLTLTMLPAYQLCAAAWPNPAMTFMPEPQPQRIALSVKLNLEPQPRPAVQKKKVQLKKAEARYFIIEGDRKVYELKPVDPKNSKIPVIRLKGAPAGTVYTVVRKGDGYEVSVINSKTATTLAALPKTAVIATSAVTFKPVTIATPAQVKTVTLKPVTTVKFTEPTVILKPVETAKPAEIAKPQTLKFENVVSVAKPAEVAAPAKTVPGLTFSVVTDPAPRIVTAQGQTINLATTVKTVDGVNVLIAKPATGTIGVGQQPQTATKVISDAQGTQVITKDGKTISYIWDGKGQTYVPGKVSGTYSVKPGSSVVYTTASGTLKPLNVKGNVVYGAQSVTTPLKYQVATGYTTTYNKAVYLNPTNVKYGTLYYEKVAGTKKAGYEAPEYRIFNGDLYKLVKRGVKGKDGKSKNEKTSIDPAIKPDHSNVLDPTKG